MKTEGMAFHLPLALLDDDDQTALGLLRTYYGQPVFGPGAATGALFDGWDSTGNRAKDTNRCTADDLVALTFQRVNIPPTAARDFLTARADRLTELLVALGPDRDLVDDPTARTDDWAGWQLMRALRAPHKMGSTKAANSSPASVPAFAPSTTASSPRPPAARTTCGSRCVSRSGRMTTLCTTGCCGCAPTPGCPSRSAALRVFDVIAWHEGNDLGF